MKQNTINLGNLLLSLSNAVDLANKNIARHMQRTAYIALEICRHTGLSDELTRNVFIAALLHDIGAISMIDQGDVQQFEVSNPDRHCVRGELLLRRIPEFKKISVIVKQHHKPWNMYENQIDSTDVIESQILLLADNVERMIDSGKYILYQRETIEKNIRKMAGTVIDSVLVKIFLEISVREDFWLDLVSPRLYTLLFHTGPLQSTEIDYKNIENISKLFRDIIDYKSPFTATHSSGVSASAEMISKIYGLSDNEILEVKIAGNLHDLGKLIVPNSILEKPGKLSRSEFELMKSHSYYTFHTINSISGLEHIAQWAGYHHEKMDGSGYPFHRKAAEIDIFSRIIAIADIFTAVTEERPYRKEIEKDEVCKYFTSNASDNLLDGRVIGLVLDNYSLVYEHVKMIQELAREFYTSRLSGI